MKNLEQIRAANALRCQRENEDREDGDKIEGKQKGEVIKKIPTMILNHGLLATMADAVENKGKTIAFDHIARHLADPEIGIVPTDIKNHSKLLEYLTSKDANSELLKQATSETMAWLGYARRFVTGGHK